MEFFGFASGTSTSGPHFSLSPESVLQGFPADLMEHPALPHVMSPDTMELSAPVGLMKTISEILDRPLSRSLGFGVLAMISAYSAWRISTHWNDCLSMDSQSEVLTIDDSEVSNPKPKIHETSGTEEGCERDVSHGANGKDVHSDSRDGSGTLSNVPGDNIRTFTPDQDALLNSTQGVHMRLVEALTQLDQDRALLKELEGEKGLLLTELELRKKAALDLQAENNSERNKRQQTEMKMEIMEAENLQLKQLRRELSQKIIQVERLEKFLRGKEQLQDPLLKENAVLPSSVTKTKAKRCSEMNKLVKALDGRLGIGEVEIRSRSSRSSVGTPKQASSSVLVLTDEDRLSVSPIAHTFERSYSTGSGSKYSKENNIQVETYTSTPHSKLSSVVPRSRSRSMCEMPKSLVKDNNTVKKSDAPRKDLNHDQSSAPPSAMVEVPCKTKSIEKVEDRRSFISHLSALIRRYTDSSSESDVSNGGQSSRFPNNLFALRDTADRRPSGNKANNNLSKEGYCISEEQSSVFLSASCGSFNKEESDQRKLPSNIRRLKAKRSSPLQRPSRPERRRTTRATELQKGPRRAPVRDDQVMRSPVHSRKTGGLGTGKKSPRDFQVRYQPKKNETGVNSGDSSDDSEDSWIVIVPVI